VKEKKMNVKYIAAIFIFFVITVNAQQQVIQLYNSKAPGSEKWSWQEKESAANMFGTLIVYNVVQPTLTVYPADGGTSNGTALIIAPGGAFHTLSYNSEGADAAKWLNKKGITVFVLKYRLVHSVTDDPVKELVSKLSDFKKLDEENDSVVTMAMNDGLTAVRYIRQHAADFKINPHHIGFMGFSAGGTVTMSVAYNGHDESRPDFIAPIYAYANAIIGSAVPTEKMPAFIVAATDDPLVPASHSVSIYSKWLAAKQPAELHMYEKGGHGFGMKTQNIPADKWIERFWEWLQVRGYY
jgi:acetyl esterase/lipase